MIEIYTDGACSQNGTWEGGWGVVVVSEGEVLETRSGSEKDTTNNRMEMMAFLEAVKYAHESDKEVTILTDSAYIYNAFTQGWITNWKRNGWKNSKKQAVKNRDLWEEMLKYPIPKIKKVKGHADNEYNNMADALAVAARGD